MCRAEMRVGGRVRVGDIAGKGIEELACVCVCVCVSVWWVRLIGKVCRVLLLNGPAVARSVRKGVDGDPLSKMKRCGFFFLSFFLLRNGHLGSSRAFRHICGVCRKNVYEVVVESSFL